MATLTECAFPQPIGQFTAEGAEWMDKAVSTGVSRIGENGCFEDCHHFFFADLHHGSRV